LPEHASDRARRPRSGRHGGEGDTGCRNKHEGPAGYYDPRRGSVEVAFVRTIRGDINPAELGATSAHDHLICMGGPQVLADPDFLLSSVDKAVDEAGYFMAAGGSAIIECGPIGMGRDISALLEINRRLPGLHIVAATGFHKGSLYGDTRVHWVSRYPVERVAELLVAEITEGIDQHDYSGPVVDRSTARAGVIKVGTGYTQVTNFERKCIEAAAMASAETGVAVTTHTEAGTMALEQAQLLIRYGADADKVIIGHLQRNPDPYYHSQVCELGVNVMYDGGYRIKYFPDSVRVQLIKDMVARGWASRILLGTDAGRRSYQRAYGGGTGIDYDLAVFRFRLLAEGVDPDVVNSFFMANPARAFSFKE
jgi:predicted metal-dependent phosphotriesterase family hydrolase